MEDRTPRTPAAKRRHLIARHGSVGSEWEMRASPAGTTPVLTHPLSPLRSPSRLLQQTGKADDNALNRAYLTASLLRNAPRTSSQDGQFAEILWRAFAAPTSSGMTRFRFSPKQFARCCRRDHSKRADAPRGRTWSAQVGIRPAFPDPATSAPAPPVAPAPSQYPSCDR